ncbi:MAG: glycoside hydrolase family 9 protein [Lachnospiraceae bacterium]|nr:glycoside hydrolase family 9 protein [Lachnospiraceae bacterium]
MAFILAGCGAGADPMGNQPVYTSTSGRDGMLDEASIEYETPGSVPSIIVDLVGYDRDAEKKAIINAEEIPDSFTIKDVYSGETVYIGKVKEVESDQGIVGIADFTEFDTEGEYQMEAPLIGSSKYFAVRSGVYDELMATAFAKLERLRCSSVSNGYCHNRDVPLESSSDTVLDVRGGWHTAKGGERDVVTGCMAVYDLITAYEYHPSSFTDKMGIPESGNKIPDILDEAIFELDWLFKMQNPETGGVYSAITARDSGLVIEAEATRATVYFCVVMTHFSYVIKKFDSKYSGKCLNAAVKAWKCLDANKELVSTEQMYRAAVELYKATGQAVYRNAVEDYLKDNAGKDLENRAVIDAAITHMSTSRATDMSECEKLMERFMARTHSKVASARTNAFFVESTDMTAEELLRNMEELVIVDYIISSVEYQKIEENYLHYLCGRNPESEIMLDFEYDPDGYAMLLVLLGRLNDRR